MVAINAASTGRRRSVKPSVGKIFLRLLLLSLCIAIYTGVKRSKKPLLTHKTPAKNEIEPSKTNSSSKEFVSSPQQRDWSYCLEDQPNNLNSHTNAGPRDQVKNPLWLPAYPTSLPEGYSSFLTELTGLPSASKLYYRKSKTLKRCHNLNVKSGFDGVTCEIVHPIVPCERPHPSAQAANFGKVVLLALRNPLTAFPNYHQEKAEKYHNAKGQVAKEEWISFRDQYVGNATHSPLFQEWKEFILEWRNMKPYHVGMYLPHEEWADETKGVELVHKFAKVLSEEGFPIQYTNNLACLWQKNVFQPALMKKQRYLDEGRFDPEYTSEQKVLLASELRKFASELDNTLPGDERLKDILTRYSEDFK
ncbi:hypothetical protein ACHAXM_005881 [Skeletonema potamos]